MQKSKRLEAYLHLQSAQRELASSDACERDLEELLALMDTVWHRLTEEEHRYLDDLVIPEPTGWAV